MYNGGAKRYIVGEGFPLPIRKATADLISFFVRSTFCLAALCAIPYQPDLFVL